MPSNDNLKPSVVDTCGRIDKRQVSTLILTAERDMLVPPENDRLLSICIPNSVEKSFAGVGHLIYLECAQGFNETVINFFRNKA